MTGRVSYPIDPIAAGGGRADRVIVDADGAWLGAMIIDAPAGASYGVFRSRYLRDRRGERVAAPADWPDRLVVEEDCG